MGWTALQDPHPNSHPSPKPRAPSPARTPAPAPGPHPSPRSATRELRRKPARPNRDYLSYFGCSGAGAVGGAGGAVSLLIDSVIIPMVHPDELSRIASSAFTARTYFVLSSASKKMTGGPCVASLLLASL